MSGLFVNTLKLSHFRSHKLCHVACDGRPIAIHGSNGAGKTNILEAVSMLSPGRGLRRARMGELSRRPEALGWKVSAELSSFGRMHGVQTWAEPGQSRQVLIDDKTAAQAALGRIARMLWLVPSMDRLWIEGADGRRRFLDRMTLSFEPGHAEVSLTFEKAMRERNRLLKDQVRDAQWYRALEAQMAEAGAQISSNRRQALSALREAQIETKSGFPTGALEIENLEQEAMPETPEELQEAWATSRPRDLLAGRTLIGPHRIDLAATYAAKGMAARDCSTGEQKALLISLILANARALKEQLGASPILLLDEVAAHLDADRRAALYDEICALGAQAWMTGTGAELFDALGPRAQYFEVREEAGNSAVFAIGDT